MMGASDWAVLGTFYFLATCTSPENSMDRGYIPAGDMPSQLESISETYEK